MACNALLKTLGNSTFRNACFETTINRNLYEVLECLDLSIENRRFDNLI
jgi:hypothetical protein